MALYRGRLAKTCPCVGCEVRIPSHMLTCRQHWFMIPKPLRDAIWATVNRDWAAWARNARESVLTVAKKEGRPCEATEFDRLIALHDKRDERQATA